MMELAWYKLIIPFCELLMQVSIFYDILILLIGRICLNHCQKRPGLVLVNACFISLIVKRNKYRVINFMPAMH